MEKRKLVSIVSIGMINIITLIMPFRLKQICYEHFIHKEWSFGAWNAVYMTAMLYSIAIIFLTIILLLNILKKSK